MPEHHANEQLLRLMIEPIEHDYLRAKAGGMDDPVYLIRSLPPCRIGDPGLAREGARRGQDLIQVDRLERPQLRGWLAIEDPARLADFDALPCGPCLVVVVQGDGPRTSLFTRPEPGR
jgi:hypothetical protein